MITALKAGATYLALVFAAGFAMGVLRVLLLAPIAGPTVAVAIEAPAILAVSWIACRWCLARFRLSRAIWQRATMGGFALVALLALEAGMSLTLFGMSSGQFLATFATAAGQIGLASQVLFGLVPLLMRRA